MSVLLNPGAMVILAAHTLQVRTRASVLLAYPASSDFDAGCHIAMVTCTTLGHGDLFRGEGSRIFGTFASITGLSTLGISAAFPISLSDSPVSGAQRAGLTAQRVRAGPS